MYVFINERGFCQHRPAVLETAASSSAPLSVSGFAAPAPSVDTIINILSHSQLVHSGSYGTSFSRRVLTQLVGVAPKSVRGLRTATMVTAYAEGLMTTLGSALLQDVHWFT